MYVRTPNIIRIPGGAIFQIKLFSYFNLISMKTPRWYRLYVCRRNGKQISWPTQCASFWCERDVRTKNQRVRTLSMSETFQFHLHLMNFKYFDMAMQTAHRHSDVYMCMQNYGQWVQMGKNTHTHTHTIRLLMNTLSSCLQTSPPCTLIRVPESTHTFWTMMMLML